MTTADPAQQDRAWLGYHPRAMAPTAVAALSLSLIVWIGRWYFDDISEFTDRLGTVAHFALAWAIWPALVGLFLYRTVTYTYRLTERAVCVDFGMFSRPVAPLPLTEVVAVVVRSGTLGRILGVGSVEVRTADRVVRMIGVRRPTAFAQKIRAALASVRGT